MFSATDNRKQQHSFDSTSEDCETFRSHLLTKYHTQSRHLSVGQSPTGYPVNKEWHHYKTRLKCMKQVQATRKKLPRLLTAQSEVVES